MSGGYFDYDQYRMHDITCKITELIASNESTDLDRWGNEIGRRYSTETLEQFKQAVHFLRLAELYAQRVDWLVSGDDSEASFHRRLADDLIRLGKAGE